MFKLNGKYKFTDRTAFEIIADQCNPALAAAIDRAGGVFVVSELSSGGSVIGITDINGKKIRIPADLAEAGVKTWFLSSEFKYVTEITDEPVTSTRSDPVKASIVGKYQIDIPGVIDSVVSETVEEHIKKLIPALYAAQRLGQLFAERVTVGNYSFKVTTQEGEKFLLSNENHVNLYIRWLNSQTACYEAYHELLDKGVRITNE